MKRTVFVIDDEVDFLNSIREFLENDQFEVICFQSGEDLFQTQQTPQHCLYLVDWNLPGINGCEIIKKIRRRDKISPIFIISGNNKHEQILEGLKSGADDYITKPFDSEVLLLKIKAVLKRNEETHREEVNAEFDMGKYHFNPRLRELTIDGKINVLSPKENELLKMLCEHKNDLLTREAALKKIWGSDTYFNGRSMDVYIAKLRKYLKEDGSIEIVNIHGNGFRLVVQ
jgi:DNA-binding response OmpR family regulator